MESKKASTSMCHESKSEKAAEILEGLFFSASLAAQGYKICCPDLILLSQLQVGSKHEWLETKAKWWAGMK